jgi:hypothetical protein
MPSKKRRRSDDDDDDDDGGGGGGGGGGGRQVVLDVPLRPSRTGHHHYDTNDIVMASVKKRHKRVHSNCNNTDNSIVESAAIESPRVNTMLPVSEANDGINDSAIVIGGGDNNFSGGGNKLASTCIMSSVPNIDQNTNTNTTHGTQGGEGGEGGMCPTTILQTLGENHVTDGVVPAPPAFNEYYPRYSQQFEIYSKFFELLTVIHRRQSRHMF